MSMFETSGIHVVKSIYISSGGVRERPNRHAWKACEAQVSVGSNPTSSAKRFVRIACWLSRPHAVTSKGGMYSVGYNNHVQLTNSKLAYASTPAQTHVFATLTVSINASYKSNINLERGCKPGIIYIRHCLCISA